MKPTLANKGILIIYIKILQLKKIIFYVEYYYY